MSRLGNIAFGTICLCAISLVSVHVSYAQSATSQQLDTLSRSNIKGPLEFKGFVKELSKKLKGAIVTLYESPDGTKDNLTEILKTVTPGSGQFEFKLEINKTYVLSVEKGGYTSKSIDFDTDVTMAREQNTKVPTFSFEVDMVQDLDGLDFAGSVASVFYQIKKNAFDWELDYSKEEMEEEERLLREQEEKREMAELAAQKKFEIEEAARLLIEGENASAQEIIKAAITVGDGNKDKTVEGFLQIFSEVDTLRNRKVRAMYDQLLEERKSTKASGEQINFQAIFNVAEKLEEEVSLKAEKEEAQNLGELRKEKEEAARKIDEAMAIQQQALELESKEKLATAIKAEELRRAKEDKEVHDKVYYAIFNSGGDAKVAIQNLVKTYPKGDSYKEEKAKALYSEYEKMRVTGSTLSKMDFGKLFGAAEEAEQKAIQKEIENDNFKQQSKLTAFMEKVEEKKKEAEEQVVNKIKEGLKTATLDRISQVAVFKDALAKNDPYKKEKAEAMYDEFVKKKQKLGGASISDIDFSSLFQVADVAEEKAKIDAKAQLVKEKQAAQDQLEAQREQLRKEKSELAKQTEAKVVEAHRAKMSETKNKKERKLADALEKGAGNRDQSVQEILGALDASGDKELDQERAEAIYDAYLEESRKIKQSGNAGLKVDFNVLFQAADKAELARLERKYEEKQAVEDQRLAEYTERRIEKATETAKAQQKQAAKEVEHAELAYEETLHKVEAQQAERLAEQKKQEEEFAKATAMELAKRESVEKERAQAELAKIEKEKQQRLEEEKAAQAAVVAAEEAKRSEQERKAKEEANRLLAQAEKAQEEAENAKQKAAEAKRKAEEKRLAEEAKSQREAELLVQKAEEKRLKEEADRLAIEAKAKEEAERLVAKAEEEKKRENDRQLAEAAKAKKDAEIAAKKEEERRLKEDQERLAAENKAKEEARIAAAKAAEEARKAEERRQAEIAAQKVEEAEQDRLAKYNGLIQKGDGALSANDFGLAKKSYTQALAVYPDNKEAANKLSQAETELARVEKENAERIALNNKFDGLMSEAESAVLKEEYADAIKKFEEASSLKPNEEKPKQRVRDVKRTVDEIAQAKKEEQAKERKYVLLMQEGNTALLAQSLVKAKESYKEASKLKPEESEPKQKLKEIDALEEQLALAELAKKEKEAEAKRKFEQQQNREEEEKAKELAARLEAMEEAATTTDQNVNAEDARIEKYERLKESIEQMDLAAEEQRKAFLSELAKIYPTGMTKERVEGKNFELLRYVINSDNVVTIYERKTWDWGGVFYFKDSDIAITEAIYKLEIGKYE